jgi:M6 family metalloprotease-like protein
MKRTSTFARLLVVLLSAGVYLSGAAADKRIGVTQALLSPATTPPAGQAAVGVRGVSAVPVHPDVAQKLRAQGRRFRDPFPNAANRGRKFNPVGETIGPLVTAATQKVLVIFVQFTTAPPGGPAAPLALSYFDDMLFGKIYDPPEYKAYADYPKDRTLYNYFKQVSYEKVDVVTANLPSAMGWANAGHSYDYYCKGDGVHDYGFGVYPRNAQGMVIDAVKAVDSLVDFRNYAVDGVVPNLFVVHTGTGAEWNVDPDIIWSHSWDVAWETAYPNGYVTNEGVTILNYATMPEVGGDLTGYSGPVTGPYPPTVGVFAHEYGHVLGLPDQYDYGYESEGTGIYSLMAGGSWNTYPRRAIFSGNSPAHLDAWSKYRLGFVTPTPVSSPAVELPPAETLPVVYRMDVPNSGGREYFLLENRQQIGFDQGLAVYGGAPGAEGPKGLAIYHIDDTVLTRSYWRPNEAENWKEFRSEGWKKAENGETHYGISIIQADGRWDMEHGVFGYFKSDLYPGVLGAFTRFGSDTSPNSSNYYFWAGSEPKFGYSGVTVADIRDVGGLIRANVSVVPWAPGKK